MTALAPAARRALERQVAAARATGAPYEAWHAALLDRIRAADAGEGAPEGTRLQQFAAALPSDVLAATDALGWAYQFWQAPAKDAVNASGRKIGGADLAPVTQLFTEPYMVRFLLENSLGAWWAGRNPGSPLVARLAYLRRDGTGAPLAGAFGGWPDTAADVTVLDPCAGTGHFLLGAFDLLWRMRAEQEDLTPPQAQDAVLRDNLVGLELDPRCARVARDALALEARRRGGERELPCPRVACCGESVRAPVAAWTALAGGDPAGAGALARVHALLRDADTLGSLVDPVRAAAPVPWAELAPLVEKALAADGLDGGGGAAEAVEQGARTYTLVATNVPYLGRARQAPTLTAHLDALWPRAAGDLATAMLMRALSLTGDGGSTATVTPQSWLTQSGFRRLRRELFARAGWPIVARLGPGAFGSITGEVVQPVLAISVDAGTAGPSRDTVAALDVTASPGPEAKAAALRASGFSAQLRSDVLSAPGVRLRFGPPSAAPALEAVAAAGVGIQTGDNERFTRHFWETPGLSPGWEYLSRAPSRTRPVSGATKVLLWDGGAGRLHDAIRARLGPTSVAAWIRGERMWDRPGVLVSRMGDLPAALYPGGAYADNCMVLAPHDERDLPALWAFAASGALAEAVRELDGGLNVTPGTVLAVPFDRDLWAARAAALPAVPAPFALRTDDPTQWLFDGEPRGSAHPLQVAVARALGYRWPRQAPGPVGDGALPLACLASIDGAPTAEERVRAALAASYGSDWSEATLDDLLLAAGGRPGDLAGWLAGAFFRDHCRLFGHRPFVWHVWDGLPDGFSALVHYHRLDALTLRQLTEDALGSWIAARAADARRQVPRAEARLRAAGELRRRLLLIAAGEAPHDVYVRWKPLADQPLGWAPDLDDGVRRNIRPFATAGVLRARVAVGWASDRGRNPDGGERRNDLHHTLAERRAARR